MSEPTISARRKRTIAAVYRCIYENKAACTKAYLAEKLELSLPTIYHCIDELVEEGLISYDGEQRSTGGRRAKRLRIVADARVAVGVAITEGGIRMVLADLYLHELAYREVDREPLWSTQQFAEMLAVELEKFLDDSGADRKKLLGVGIAIPGVISADRSTLLLAPTLGLKEIALNDFVSRISYPVYLENDGTCSGRAETFVRGDVSNMAYLSLEHGIGGAAIIAGTPYAGDNMRSGEFGHMCVEPAGLPCKCGKRGCLEAYCSSQRIRDALGVGLDEFFLGLREHIPEYEVLWHDLLRHLAIGINNIRMALDCDVVLGGMLTEHIAPYMSQLREYVTANNTFEDSADYLQLSVLRHHTVPLGAALSYINAFLQSV